jgi:DNA-binding MarR family transcriptional regulator
MDELEAFAARPRGLVGPVLDHVARRVRLDAESELAVFNLRPRHVLALMVLREMGEPSQASLAETLRIDPVNVVGLLNDLESAQLVERHRSPQDRRRHVVLLTDAGSRRLDEVERALAGAERRTLSALDDDQMKTLGHLLQLITTNIAHSDEGSQ